MSEERKRSAELNEAALEGVSGGDGHPRESLDLASKICEECHRAGRWEKRRCNTDGSGLTMLTRYIYDNGPIDGFRSCPYRIPIE